MKKNFIRKNWNGRSSMERTTRTGFGDKTTGVRFGKGSQKPKRKASKPLIAPFQGTSEDWIRFKNQYHAQVDNQPVRKIVKFGCLLELVNGPCRDLNIPNKTMDIIEH